MQKKISLSILITLTPALLFIACEDSSVMDVSLGNIDKISDANLKSKPSQNSSVNIDNLSSTNIISSDQSNLSSEKNSGLSSVILGSSAFKTSSAIMTSSTAISSETLSSNIASSAAISSIALSSTTTTAKPCETAWDTSAKGGSGYSEGDIVSGSDNHNYQACEWTKSNPTTTTNMPKNSKNCGDWQDKGVWLDLGACS
jgi:hypothetical protein